jgi:rhodanese-related sulfurtransferase/thioredoxin-related protein
LHFCGLNWCNLIMKHLISRLSPGLVLVLALAPARATQLTWLTSLPKAQAQASAENKSVLLFFHGSDWCPPCIEMQRQVLDSPEFINYARQTLVLVDVDFPEKVKQDEELKKADLALKARFNVGDALPTLVLLDDAGETVYQEAGYAGGGPAEVLPSLQRHVRAPSTATTTTGYKDVSVAEFAKLTEDKQNVILDVRTKTEFEAGHIAGAINLDVMSPDFPEKAAALDKSKTYLVHCATGVRSERACKKLAKLDFPKLYNLPGGFKAWVKAGEPVEK